MLKVVFVESEDEVKAALLEAGILEHFTSVGLLQGPE